MRKPFRVAVVAAAALVVAGGVAAAAAAGGQDVTVAGCLANGRITSVSVTSQPSCAASATPMQWAGQVALPPSPSPTDTSPSPTPTDTSPSPTPTDTSPSPTPTSTSPAGLPDGQFPIGVWSQFPQNDAAAFKAIGVNTYIGISNVSGVTWPQSFGGDLGQYAAACANGQYIIGGGNPSSSTSNDSVASVLALLGTRPDCAKYFLGYQWGDEPPPAENVPAQIATIGKEDPGHLTYDNQAGWYPDYGASRTNLNAPSIASADGYYITTPWDSPALCGGHLGAACLYGYGLETDAVVANADPGKPVWMFVETGTDVLGVSSQNGSVCNHATNQCSNGNEWKATPAQVNSAAWLTLIHGSQGLEWFCDDTLGYDYCGTGYAWSTQQTDPAIPDNLKYIDGTVQGFAAELLSPTAGGVTVSSSNGAVPISEMTKQAGGSTWIFAEGDRLGTTTGTYTDASLAGKTATLVYDSQQHYNPAASEQGQTFTLDGAGSFSDSIPSDYAVKIYKVGP